MKNIRKALLYLLIPLCFNIIVIIVLAATGAKDQISGFSFGAGIVFVFSLIWILTINRFRMTNVVTFIKRFTFLSLLKFVILLLMLILSLDILSGDRFYFVFGFLINTLFTMPIEIWLSLQKGKTDASL